MARQRKVIPGDDLLYFTVNIPGLGKARGRVPTTCRTDRIDKVLPYTNEKFERMSRFGNNLTCSIESIQGYSINRDGSKSKSGYSWKRKK